MNLYVNKNVAEYEPLRHLLSHSYFIFPPCSAATALLPHSGFPEYVSIISGNRLTGITKYNNSYNISQINVAESLTLMSFGRIGTGGTAAVGIARAQVSPICGSALEYILISLQS